MEFEIDLLINRIFSYLLEIFHNIELWNLIMLNA